MHLFILGRAPDEYHEEFKKFVKGIKDEIKRGITIKEIKLYEIQFDEEYEEEIMKKLNFFRYDDDPKEIDWRNGQKIDLDRIHKGFNIDKALNFGLKFVKGAEFVKHDEFGKENLPYRPDGGPWWLHLIYLAKLKDPKTEDGRDIL